jgi:hypothetical protein
MLSYQPLYVNCIHQIHYLFKNRLSDKLYFRIFTHVVFVSAKTKLQHEGEGLRITPPKTKPCEHAFVFKIVRQY